VTDKALASTGTTDQSHACDTHLLAPASHQKHQQQTLGWQLALTAAEQYLNNCQQQHSSGLSIYACIGLSSLTHSKAPNLMLSSRVAARLLPGGFCSSAACRSMVSASPVVPPRVKPGRVVVANATTAERLARAKVRGMLFCDLNTVNLSQCARSSRLNVYLS
jgi:hypothetical protein